MAKEEKVTHEQCSHFERYPTRGSGSSGGHAGHCPMRTRDNRRATRIHEVSVSAGGDASHCTHFSPRAS